MIDIRQTHQYARYLKEIGWDVERVGKINYFIKKLPIIGAIMKIQRPEEIKTSTIDALSKKYKVRRVIVEPKNIMDAKYLLASHYRQSSAFLPTKTLHINLTKSKEQLLKEMEKDARLIITRVRDKKIKIIETRKEIEKFRDIWRKSVGLRRYVPSTRQLTVLKKIFKKDSLFLLQRDSGAIFLKGDKIAYYWQAFTGKVGRENYYQYKIVWDGILWAKAKGAKIFDFEGIFDNRFPNTKWRGFSHFKKSFGGVEIEYPGAYLKILRG